MPKDSARIPNRWLASVVPKCLAEVPLGTANSEEWHRIISEGTQWHSPDVTLLSCLDLTTF